MRLSAAPVMPSIPVSDMGKSRRFYTETLGLKPVKDLDEGTVLAAGDTLLFLYERAPAPAQHTLASFVVDDLATTMKDLRKQGVEFEEYTSGDLTTKDGIADTADGRSAWFRDPDGNILAVTEVRQADEFMPQVTKGRKERENLRIARQAWKDVAAGLERVLEYYDPKIRYHSTELDEIRGVDALRQYLAPYFVAFPDISIDVEDIFAVGDRVAVRWTATGKHTGPLNDIPATNKKVEFGGVTIHRFRNGKIVEEWETISEGAMMSQLGRS